MAVSLAPKNLKRYKDIAWLLVKYGRADWAKGMGLESETAPASDGGAPVPPQAEELVKDLESLGPTFVKVGQLLSTRAALLPPPYLEALGKRYEFEKMVDEFRATLTANSTTARKPATSPQSAAT